MVAQHAETSQVVLWVVILIVIYGGLSLALKASELRSRVKSHMFRMRELAEVGSVLIDSDYQLLEDPDFQKAKELAFSTVKSNDSLTQKFPLNLKRFTEQVLKIALFGSLLSTIDLRFLGYIGVLILLVIAYRFFQHRFINKTKAERATYIDQYYYLHRVTSNFKMAKDVRLYRVQPWFLNIFEEVLKNLRHITVRRSRVVFGGQFISAFLILLLTFYGYSVLILQLIEGRLNVGELTFYIGAISMIAIASSELINVLFDLLDDSNDAGHLRHFLHYPPLFNHVAKQTLPELIDTIELKNVTFTYPQSDRPIFKNFNLTIHQNEKIALVGLNGAGKTTLVKLLLHLYQPQEGQILINGMDHQRFAVNDYYRLFSVVFQDHFPLPMTIRETVLQDSAYDEVKYRKVLEDSGLLEVTQGLPLGDDTPLVREMNAEAVTLSGGQHQKLKLAQALYKDAPVLILDEPTAALDPLAESEIYRRYHKYSKDKLSIFITHRLATTQFCDRILFLEDGKIIEDGTHRQLMDMRGKYQQMYDKQAYYYQEGERE